MKRGQNLITKPEGVKRKIEKSILSQNLKRNQKVQNFSSQKIANDKSSNSLFKKNNDAKHDRKILTKSKQNLIPNYRNNSLSKRNANQKRNVSQPKSRNAISQNKSNLLPNHYKSVRNINNSRMIQENYRSNTQKNRAISQNKSKSKNQNQKQIQISIENIQKQQKTELKYSFRTRQGALSTNPNKTNQDRLLIIPNAENKSIFAVADGHGAHGHLVSQNIVSSFYQILQKHKELNTPQRILPKVYEQLQQNLTHSDINVSCSGSTLVSLIIQQKFITCANVGDSRALLARQVDKKNWELVYLSEDQKPSVPLQKKRILKAGGRVHALKDENGQDVGPMRVWLPNQNVQGLAMSRSLGDNISKPFGVTHQPQITKVPLQKNDKFILIASDGVWQFISNQQVLKLLVPFYKQNKLQQACDALLQLAYDKWTDQDNSVIDDITFILIFL